MVPIITYHAIGDTASPVFTPAARFEAQLEALAAAGYQTVSLAAVVAWLKTGAQLPPSSIVLTFDDGYLSVYSEAWPRLKHYGFRATLFLISDYCGRDNQWPGQPASVPRRPMMEWSHASEMASEGCELAAHTHTHPPLTLLSPSQIEGELLASQSTIHALTGHRPRIFAQPYGATDGKVDEIVRRHFDGAASTRLGIVQSETDPFSLSRIDAFYWHPWLVARMNSRSFRWYLRMRQKLRQMRRSQRPDWQQDSISAIYPSDK